MVTSLETFTGAPPLVVVHATLAAGAFLLGLLQFALPKGTPTHRRLGWIWVGLMAAIAASSLFIHVLHQFGPFSAIHLLSLYVLATLPWAVLAARRHRVTRHAWSMIGLFAGALLIAGGFTLMPGRLMHAVVFGH